MRVSGIYDTQQEAILLSRRTCQSGDGGELLVAVSQPESVRAKIQFHLSLLDVPS